MVEKTKEIIVNHPDLHAKDGILVEELQRYSITVLDKWVKGIKNTSLTQYQLEIIYGSRDNIWKFLGRVKKRW